MRQQTLEILLSRSDFSTVDNVFNQRPDERVVTDSVSVTDHHQVAPCSRHGHIYTTVFSQKTNLT